MKKPTAMFREIKPAGPPVEIAPVETYDRAIAAGFGDVLTNDGFTIRQARALLYGDPNAKVQDFVGLLAVVPK